MSAFACASPTHSYAGLYERLTPAALPPMCHASHVQAPGFPWFPDTLHGFLAFYSYSHVPCQHVPCKFRAPLRDR